MKILKDFILENNLDNFNDEDFSFKEINELVKDDSLLKKEIRDLNPKVEKLQRELLKIWDD